MAGSDDDMDWTAEYLALSLIRAMTLKQSGRLYGVPGGPADARVIAEDIADTLDGMHRTVIRLAELASIYLRDLHAAWIEIQGKNDSGLPFTLTPAVYASMLEHLDSNIEYATEQLNGDDDAG